MLYRLVVSAFLSFFVFTSSASAERFSRILGGEPVDLQSTAVAFLFFDDTYCSGMLVGAREVLTAAHCVVGTSSPVSDWRVLVGGEVYSVSEAFYHSSYDFTGDVLANSPYDLGIILLDRIVTNVSPAPIMTEYPLTIGEDLAIFGYGTNEISGDTDITLEDLQRGALITVADLANGLFASSHSLDGASGCNGDSGGPVVELIDRFASVVGVTSAGDNVVVNSYCVLGGGLTIYVDLQSESSQNFLSLFPGVLALSGRNAIFLIGVEQIQQEMALMMETQKPGKLKRYLKQLRKSFTESLALSDSKRTPLVKKFIRLAKKSKKKKGKKAITKHFKKAQSVVDQLVSLGVS